MVMPYHLHMPSYFLETFTEYPYLQCKDKVCHLSVQSHDIGILDSQTSLFIAIINESRKGIYQNHYL